MPAKCHTCGQDYVEGRICAVQKKQDGHVLCVPERVVRKSPGPARVKRNLMVARFTFPQYTWNVATDGAVFSRIRGPDAAELEFSLSNPGDLKATRNKLLTLGWEIKETTRDRKPYYKAVKHLHEPGKPKTESGQEHEDIEILIGRIVEKVLEGR